MKIHLPNSAYLGNIDSFVRGFDPSVPDRLEVTANDKWISVHPVVLSMIAAIGFNIEPKNIKLDPLEARSAHYLIRMGLLKMLNIPSPIQFTEHDPAGRFIPLSKIQTSTDLSRFITEMIPLLHLEPEPAQTIAYIVSELGRNVIEHAEDDNGAFLCAQYYKKSNSIRIGIADRGVGIRTTINRSYSTKTDLDAIQLALIPGITGVTRREGGNEQNAGAGLFFTKSIASVNRDFFFLYSGDAFYKLLKKTSGRTPRLWADPFRDRHSKRTSLPYWQGTVVGIDMTLDQTENFSRLLDGIRDTYRSAIRERKKARHRKPRFI